MSWLDIFPFLDDAMVDEYFEGRTPEETALHEQWFSTARVLSAASNEFTDRKEIVSTCLFWKHIGKSDPDLPTVTRHRLVNARRLGLVRRLDPWNSYVLPLLEHEHVIRKYPEVEFRIYLAADLEFLAGELLQAGWSVHLMRSNSLRYCPGGFWRFLALGEDRLVTVIDADRMRMVEGEIARTRLMAEMDLGLWRSPGYYHAPIQPTVRYRPLLGGHFGAVGGMPVKNWIEAFVWHSLKGSMPSVADLPARGPTPIAYVEWPGYGFDEWFQMAGLFPRLVEKGTLSFVPFDARSTLLPIDIEYVTSANPRSEIVFF